MTGNQIRKLRERLELDPVLFSRLLGVHLSTVYRWENAKKPKIDIMQTQILWWISERWEPKATGLDKLKEDLLRHPLEGLRTLLAP